jgi:hypothetical protein
MEHSEVFAIAVQVTDGKLKPVTKTENQTLRAFLDKMEGQRVTLYFKQYAPERSLAQNRRLWGYLVPLFRQWVLDEWGMSLTNDEAKAYLTAKFSYVEFVNPDTGQTMQVPKGTSELDKKQFAEFMNRTEQWLTEFCNLTLKSTQL